MTGAPPADPVQAAPRAQKTAASSAVNGSTSSKQGEPTSAGDAPAVAAARKTSSPAPIRASKRQRTVSQSKTPSQATAPAPKVAKTVSNGQKTNPEVVKAGKSKSEPEKKAEIKVNGSAESNEIEPVAKKPTVPAPKVRVTPSNPPNGRSRTVAARKDTVTPKAWAWMSEKENVNEINFHDVRSVYRLFADPHIPCEEENHGKKNCRFNPLCYIGKISHILYVVTCAKCGFSRPR